MRAIFNEGVENVTRFHLPPVKRYWNAKGTISGYTSPGLSLIICKFGLLEYKAVPALIAVKHIQGPPEHNSNSGSECVRILGSHVVLT